jgi:alkyl hydroperoxide reductase subunit AhpC
LVVWTSHEHRAPREGNYLQFATKKVFTLLRHDYHVGNKSLCPRRATFIVDPENLIRFVYVTDLSVGRDPQEVLRVLDALQNGGLTPCGWHKGEATIQV